MNSLLVYLHTGRPGVVDVPVPGIKIRQLRGSWHGGKPQRYGGEDAQVGSRVGCTTKYKS